MRFVRVVPQRVQVNVRSPSAVHVGSVVISPESYRCPSASVGSAVYASPHIEQVYVVNPPSVHVGSVTAAL